MRYSVVLPAVIALVMALSDTAAPADDAAAELRFEHHRFAPQTIIVPANRPLRIKITNASAETIEFESFKLNREKVIGPGEAVIVFLPALEPGSYDFYDDLHGDVPEGTIAAK